VHTALTMNSAVLSEKYWFKSSCTLNVWVHSSTG